MKTAITLLCCALSVGISSQAQTLEQATEGLVPMPSVQTFYGTVSDPGPSGEAVTWDMSSLVPGSGMELTYTDAVGGPFESATTKESYFQDFIIWNRSHYQLTNDALLIWGAEANALYGSDPMQVLPFPCSYGTTWTDAFAFEVTGYYTITGTVEGVADGYGTLAMPYGDVENVLRVKLTMDYTFAEVGQQPAQLSAIDYVYYRPGLSVPVLTSRDGPSVMTAVDMMGSRWVGAAIALGLDNAPAEEARRMTICPNPASTETFVRFDATTGTVIELADAAGRVVMAKRINATSPSLFNERLDLSGFAPGSYCLTLRYENGLRSARKLIVE